jgi:CoA-transferase family III
MRDLEGIQVVSLEQAVAAPYASGRLADAGARVIKVERPQGDFARRYDALVQGESAYFVWLNRGKESLSLDLKSPKDLALLQDIIAKADVFIQNLAPGTATRLWLGAEELTRAHPRLIYCSISVRRGRTATRRRMICSSRAKAASSRLTVGPRKAPASAFLSATSRPASQRTPAFFRRCSPAHGRGRVASLMYRYFTRSSTG